MKFGKMIESLERFEKLLPVMVEGVSDSDAKWKPDSGNWSIVEIVSHLVDEEREDFRIRFRMTIEEPTQPWPSWDPEGVAISRDYNSRDLSTAVNEFIQVRRESVDWLKSLNKVDFDLTYKHPKMGEVPAGNMLASWVAHDLLHVRQIAKRLYELTIRDAEGFDVSYAGKW